jgi:spermidine/putrescine transport system permease protein
LRRTGPVSLLGLAPLASFFLFLFVPLCLVAASSFFERGPYGGIEFKFTLNNFLRALDPIYLKIFWESSKLAFLTSILSALIGFPVAYAIATQSARWRLFWLLLIALPSLTSLVVRIYAIRSFLSPSGIAGAADIQLGPGLVLFGMVSAYLPFFVLPVAAALEKFNFLLVDAARDLGESDTRIMVKVVLPQMKAPIKSGLTLVFIPSFGEFLIPDLLGGARTMLAGNLITEQFLRARDWPFGSALTLLLFLFLGGVYLLARWIFQHLYRSEPR